MKTKNEKTTKAKPKRTLKDAKIVGIDEEGQKYLLPEDEEKKLVAISEREEEEQKEYQKHNDFYLKPLNKEGTIFIDETSGAVFTLEQNLFDRMHFLKRMNKGCRDEKPIDTKYHDQKLFAMSNFKFNPRRW